MINNSYKNDKLRLLAKTWEDNIMDNLTNYLITRYHYSKEDALGSLINFFVYYQFPKEEKLQLIIAFIMNFKNTVFNLNSDDYTKDVSVIKIPNTLDPEIINYLRNSLIDYGLIIRKTDDNSLITYFNNEYTDDIVSEYNKRTLKNK